MAVRVEYKASVTKDLEGLSRSVALRILRKIEQSLASGSGKGVPLTGEFAGLYRIRVGDYRVIYARTEAGYLVLRIGHRSEVYRGVRPT